MPTDDLLGEALFAEWEAGAVAGFVGGLFFGAVLSLLSPAAMEGAIPALVGLSGGVVGWVVHMSVAVTLGVVFAAVGGAVPTAVRDLGEALQFGALYGFVVWAVLAVFVMPVWLAAVGFTGVESAGAPDVPNVSVVSLAGHLLYGLLLGGVYAGLTE